MQSGFPVAMVRCRLDDSAGRLVSERRYVPAAEFNLWRYLMETKHQRVVVVERYSVWVPEMAETWDEGLSVEELEPVMRVLFERPGPDGVMIPVIRYFPAETFPQAKTALLKHFDVRCRWTLEVTPGYFVNVGQQVEDAGTAAADAAAAFALDEDVQVVAQA
jgi:hypothetical protein